MSGSLFGWRVSRSGEIKEWRVAFMRIFRTYSGYSFQDKRPSKRSDLSDVLTSNVVAACFERVKDQSSLAFRLSC